MFSPMGNKKALLQMKLGLEVTAPIKSRQSSMDMSNFAPSTSAKYRQGSMDFTALAKKIENKMMEQNFGASTKNQSSKNQDMKSAASSIASTSALEKALSHIGHIGVVMNKIMESTIRYRPERDAIVLKAFQSKNIEYDLFRHSLHATFWLTFSDEEYAALIEYFDPQQNGVLNGYDFMIAFIRLGGIRKDREAIEVREKQEFFMKQTKDDEERKKLELEKKMEIAANFNFTEDVRQRAQAKLMDAATKFDASHPSAPSVEGFYVNTMKPYTFRELIKLTFNLKVDRDELGALLKTFDDNISAENSNINASDFLRYFLRLGFEGREKRQQVQRERQAQLDQIAAEEQTKKLREQNEKLVLNVDYNYNENDEKNAMEKLREASTKYDKTAPGSVSLDGFECESLDPGQFKDILRRVFNITLTNAELGFLVQKYDVKKIGSVLCKPFLTEFFRMGQETRHKAHSDQLKKQRNLSMQFHQNHLKKIHDVQNSERIRIKYDFSDENLQSGLDKITSASVAYDKVRGVSLESFEPSKLSPLDFKKAMKRTFNLAFTAEELGALVKYFDKDNINMVNCAEFLTTFTTLGAAEKFKIRSDQLKAQRDALIKQREEDNKKVLTLASKVQYNVDFEFSEQDRDSAIQKITIAATKYDANHPSALGLDGFERNAMEPGEFKELVRRTFNLKLTGQEVGAVFKMFDPLQSQDESIVTQIDCGEFLQYFLSLGFAERSKVHKEQLERQRKENKDREEADKKKVEELANRGTFTVDMKYEEEDKESIMAKINTASEGFDKNHPAAPSLEAFEVSHMPPGLFRENLKRVFGIQATPREIGVLMHMFDKGKTGKIDSKEFMLKFQSIGKHIRAEKRKEFLTAKRLAEKTAKEEEERKLAAQYEKAELQVDFDCTAEDYNSAVEKMTAASAKYDKAHPSAPSLDGFTGGPIKPGQFRELMRRAFNVWFTPKELGAVVTRNRHPSDPNVMDGKAFLIFFLKLGYDARDRAKAYALEKQRKVQAEREQEKERKLHLAAQRVVIKVGGEFSEADRDSAIRKITTAAVKYDKNSPGSVSMEAFDAAYLTPGMFREVMKRTLNIVFTPFEMSAMVAEFNNGNNNINSQAFMVNFIKLGTDERDKIKAIQLDKQRKQNYLRRTEHERKMQEAENKMILDIEYKYTDEEKGSAFAKLALAAKKYDKSHPGSMSLDGFEEKELKAHVFREMLKRTFNIIFTTQELAAIMHYFDNKKTGMVFSKKFLIYFLKIGITERDKDHRASMQKLREDAANRSREETEKLAAQWAKTELNLNDEFTQEEREIAMEKLADAACKFDPASPGPMGLTAFDAQYLSPAVFREMLKRSFNMKVTPGELAALVHEFDSHNTKKVDCKEFMVRFTAMGFEKRSEMRTKQLHRQRSMTSAAIEETTAKQQLLDSKLDAKLDHIYSDEDVHSALEKIRVIASNYDRAHASAPSLEGFMGTNMKPNEFKDMLSRTFHVTLTPKELTAVAHYFPVEEVQERASTANPAAGQGLERGSETLDDGSKSLNRPYLRINNQQFLIYFNKIQREEQSKRRKERINKERELIQRELEYQQSKITEKKAYDMKLLEHDLQDEGTLLEKIRHAAKEYAVDSAIYNDLLQGFKGPALPANKFQDLFKRVFSIKLTFPELGVLLEILDISGIGTFDGNRFLNWFYKIARIEESIMLGNTSDPVTMDTLRVNVQRPGTVGGVNNTATRNNATRSSMIRNSIMSSNSNNSKHNSVISSQMMHGANSNSLNASSGMSEAQMEHAAKVQEFRDSVDKNNTNSSADMNHIQAKKKEKPVIKINAPVNNRYPYSFEEQTGNITSKSAHSAQSEDSNSANTFTKSTLQKAWFLPSLTTSPTRKQTPQFNPFYDNSASNFDENQSKFDDQKYLSGIFSASVTDSQSLFQASSILDDTENELHKQLINKLVGPDDNVTNNNSKDNKNKSNKNNSSTNNANNSVKPIKSMGEKQSNVAVYTNLSSTGKLSSVLQDENIKYKQTRIHTAPAATTKPRAMSPLSTTQMMLAPLNSTIMSENIEKMERNEFSRTKSPNRNKRSVSPSDRSHSPSTQVNDNKKSNSVAKNTKNSAFMNDKNAKIVVTVVDPVEGQEKEAQFLQSLFTSSDTITNSIYNTSNNTNNTTSSHRSTELLSKLDKLTQQKSNKPAQKSSIHNKKPLLSASVNLDQHSAILIPAVLPGESNKGKKGGSAVSKSVEVNKKDPINSSGAGFFFPTLLATPLSTNTANDANGDALLTSEDSTVLKGVPNIDVSGLVDSHDDVTASDKVNNKSPQSKTNVQKDSEVQNTGTRLIQPVENDVLRDIFNMKL